MTSNCACGRGPAVTDPPRLAGSGAEGRVTVPAGTYTLRGANPSRRTLAFVNETGAPPRVGYSDAVGPTVGLLLSAGATYIAETTAAVYVWSAAGGPVSYAEELDVTT